MSERPSCRLSALTILVISCSISAEAQDLLFHAAGDSDATTGYFIRNLGGDVTGDGVSDFLASGNTVQIRSGVDGGLIFDFEPGTGHWFPDWAPAGDVNNDGFPDYIYTDYGPLEDIVYVRSGFDHSFIHTIREDNPGDFIDRFGETVRGLGDLNNDGFDDFLITIFTIFGVDTCRIYSGQDKTILGEFTSNSSSDWLGFDALAVGDVNGDGHTDLAVSGNNVETQDAYYQYVAVYSGADWSKLYEVRGETYDSFGDRFGSYLALGPDLDGDGVTDIMTSAYEADYAGVDSGSVFAISGATGTELRRIDGQDDNEEFGRNLGIVGDVNGDGVRDVMVGQRSGVTLLSGRNLVPLVKMSGVDPSFGLFGDFAGDLNGDDIDDFLIGVPGVEYGLIAGFAGRELFIDSTPKEVSFGSSFEITMTGSVPGAPVVLFLWTVDGNPNIHRLTNVLTLDSDGLARLSLPAPPAPSGTVLEFVAFSLGVQGRVTMSQVVSVTVR